MPPFNNSTRSAWNSSDEVKQQHEELLCVDGIILPAWMPLQNVSTGVVAFRGIIYIASLIYLFVGVAILADKFMASIEMITSKKKVVKVKDENGKTQTVVVRVWNETVANLTLMALGCSCPEILLSSIEIIGKGFEAGEMGPGSTVGSAAFNLFVIIGVCNWAIPDGQVRKVKRVSVFLVTAAWSIFAYLWLYLITAVISPGVIEVWEALVTFAFFPMTVLSAYVADRHVHIYDYISKTYRMGRNGVIVEMTTDEAEVVNSEPNDRISNCFKKFAEETENEEIREFENHRRAFIILLKNLRRKYPMLKSNQLELMATKEMLNRGSKSKAFYQVLASKMLTGRVEHSSRRPKLNLTELFQEFHPSSTSPAVQPRNNDRQITKVFFSPAHYTVMENVGQFDVTVVREDGDLERLVFVDYTTEDGEAMAGKDFEVNRGTICFEPGVTSQTISIRIIDDDLYEEDQHFYIRLLNIRTGNRFEYLCGKGEIADDAYLTTVEIHGEIAPSYSMTLDVENFGDTAPPRYSVTAREILSALKSNKNLRRPSWFHYDESDGELSTTGDDDVFVDAVSQFETSTIDENDQVFQGNRVKCSDSNKGIANNDAMTLSPSQTTLVTSVSYSSGRVSLTKLKSDKTDRKRSVEFFSERESSNNSDSENDSCTDVQTRGNQIGEHSHLRLICPSMATVMILDDDHRGIFSLSERSVSLTETVGTHVMLIVRIGGSRGRVAITYRTEEGTAKPNRDYLHSQGEIIFEDGETERHVLIQIIGESLYEKNVFFYFTIGEPKSIKDGDSDESIDDLEELSMREYSQLSEQQRIALRGRAQLGEVTTTVIHLKESKQFKKTVDKMVSKANKSLKRGTSSWLQQFIDAVHMEEENEEAAADGTAVAEVATVKKNKWKEYTTHAITVFWRLVFAVIPPECMGGGYPCFFSSVVCIGIMTALIGDVASHLGCTVGLKDSVTALAFVSLGTSLPDLFASKVSAVQDEHADASISNVTGANAVNVFLGIGVAWSLAAFHHSYNGTVFHVEAGTLAFSVTLYCVMAIIAIVLLSVRRCDAVGGELGGPMKYKLPTTALLIGCFILYILLSSMESYEIINGF